MLNNRLTVLCKSAFICLLICFVTWNTHAQSTVTIGTGTATDYNFPFQPYFNNGWSSQIYTATEIGTAGTINSLAFYVNNSSGSYTLDNQKIYVRHTSVSQHADKYYPGTTGFTLVYSGSITFGTSGWKTINLSSPFAYNGTNNLEVLIESRDGSTFTSALQTRYTSKSEYRTKYDYNDYNFPTTWYAGGRVTKLPNIQFVINTCSVVAGTVSTTTPSICSGSTASLTLSGQTSGQTIQWQTSTDNTTFSDIAGANAATYTTPALTTASYFRAKVGSGSCIVSSTSQSIAILSLPTAPTVGSNSPVCVGSSLNLTASTIAGASYAWTGPNGFISSLQNPVVNTQADTIHRGAYTLVLSLNGCSSSAQTTAVVNTYPSTLAVTASNLRIQAGESTTLTASGVTNYTWDSNLGAGSVKVVSPTQTTTYTVSGDNGNACVEQEAITIDVVNPTNTGVNSETVSIGTGTATDYNVPLQTYFNYGWSSQLYLASEIRGAGYLNSLSFYTVNSGSSYTLENQKVYVRHTQESSFADKYYPTTTGFTLVYSGPVTITSSGWLTIPFSSAFNYNGTSNLEVLVESRDGSTFTSAIQTRYTNQSGTSIYRTKFDYNNNEFPTNYNQGGRLHHYANIQFNKTVCNLPSLTLTSNSPVCAGGILQLSADTIQGATYTWTGPNGYSSSEISPIVSTNSTITLSGLYTLTYSQSICSTTQSMNVIVSDNSLSQTTLDTLSICSSESILLGVPFQQNEIYSWEGDALISCDTCSQTKVSSDTTGILKLIITRSTGCIQTKNYVLNVKLSPSVSYTLNNSISKEETILDCSGAEKISCYKVSSNEQVLNVNNSFLLSPEAETNFVIKGDNLNGCLSYDTIKVSGYPLKVRYTVIQPTIQQGGIVTVNPIRGKAPYKYIWGDEFSINPLYSQDLKISEGSKRIEMNPGIYSLTIVDSLQDSLHYTIVLSDYLGWNPNANYIISDTKIQRATTNSDSKLISKDILSTNSNSFISHTINSLTSSYSFGLIALSDTLFKDSIDTLLYGFEINQSQISTISNNTFNTIDNITYGENIALKIENKQLLLQRNGITISEFPLYDEQKYVVVLESTNMESIDNIRYYSDLNLNNQLKVQASQGNTSNSQKPSLSYSKPEGLVNIDEIQWKSPVGEVFTTEKVENLIPGNYQLSISQLNYILNSGGVNTRVTRVTNQNYLIGDIPRFIPNTNITIFSGNSLTKSMQTTNEYQSGEAYFEDVFEVNSPSWVSFKMPQISSQELQFGLSSSEVNTDYLRFQFTQTNNSTNQYQIIEGANTLFTKEFLETDQFAVERYQGDIRFYQNGIAVYTAANFHTSESLRPYFKMRTRGGGATEIKTSLNGNRDNSPIKYAVLQKSIEGTIVKSKSYTLCFKYKEEYTSNSNLEYRIYEVGKKNIYAANQGSSVTASYYGNPLTTHPGDNFLIIDLCKINNFVGHGILEVISSKNEKMYVRFYREAYDARNCELEPDTPEPGGTIYHGPITSY